MKHIAFLVALTLISPWGYAQKVIGQFKSYVHIGSPGEKET